MKDLTKELASDHVGAQRYLKHENRRLIAFYFRFPKRPIEKRAEWPATHQLIPRSRRHASITR
jgi:hypothetical protein